MTTDAGTEPGQAAHAAGYKEPAGPHPALHVNRLYVYAKQRHHDDIAVELTASPHGTTVSWIQNGQPASAPLA